MICPVCNALSPLEVSCPNCGSVAEDEGRWNDWSGPYAPYEPVLSSTEEASNFTDGEICLHAARCMTCHYPFAVEITARHI